MKMKKAGIILLVSVLIAFSTLAVPLLISENANAHPPSKIYLTYDAGSGALTVYISHDSTEPDTHYIEKVTVSVNRVEYLSEAYTSQELDAKGMVTYSYTVVASDGDVISVTAECSIDGAITGTLTVGSSDKDDPKDDPKDYPPNDDPKDDSDNVGDSTKDGDASQDNGEVVLLLGAIVGVLVVIIVLLALLLKKKKGTPKKDKIKKDEWTACPKCGSSIKMGKLSSHLDTVHPKLSKMAKDKMIDQVTKRVQTRRSRV